MSKLSEMLAARKGVTNASSQVLQPQTKQVETPAPIVSGEGKKPSILEQLRAKPVEQPKSIGQIEQNTRTSEPGILVEPGLIIPPQETMPPGLSMMQRMKWEREHNVRPSKTESSAGSSVQGITKNESKPIGPGGQSIRNEGNSLSASRTADDQKTNDGTIQVAELKSNLEYLANNIENKELVGQVVRTIAMQVARHPEIGKHMTRGEVNLMVRGLRMSYQQAAMNKQAKQDGKKKGDKNVDELTQMFKDAGVSFKF